MGVGRETQQNGIVYTGEFKNGKKNGKGIKNFPDGTVQKGLFINGEFKLAFQFKDSEIF